MRAKSTKLLLVVLIFLVILWLFSGLLMPNKNENNSVVSNNQLSVTEGMQGIDITLEVFVKRYNISVQKYSKESLYLENGQRTRNSGYGNDAISWFLNDGASNIKAIVSPKTNKIIKIEGYLDKSEMDSGDAIECLICVIKALSSHMEKYKAETLAERLFEHTVDKPEPRRADADGLFYIVHNDNQKGSVTFSAINVDDI